MNLSLPISTIPRVSAAYAKRLNRLGVKTIEDLLRHFPHRYDDLSKMVKIASLQINEIATVRGEIINIKMLRTFKKKMWLTEALIKDDSGTTRAVWYNQPFLVRTYKKGTWISLAGKVNYGNKTFFFSNPAHEKTDPPSADQESELRHTGRLVPIYSETAGLTSRWLRYILKIILPKALPEIKDFLPDEIKKSQKLIELKQAIEKIHFPETQSDIDLARQRLGFDELFLIQLYVLEQKQKWQSQNSPRIKFSQSLIKDFVDSLPFKLTDAQRKSAWEILQDLEKPKPMNRLLEGDVGSGKTVVAAIAALQTIKANFQVALMAPTEILAQQHFNEISKLLTTQKVIIGLLTSNESVIARTPHLMRGTKQSSGDSNEIAASLRLGGAPRNDKIKLSKKDLLEKISGGEINILIGTHALIQEKIKFKNLGLAILDEQHRFGVNQRAALQKNIANIKDETPKQIPHLLSMTATPIPRTLALTIYGDLDLSIINEMPKGRQKIITKIVAPANRQKAYDFIRQQVKSGRQVFVICPRIERKKENENESKPATNWRLGGWAGARSAGRQFVAGEQKNNLWSDVKTVKEEYEKLSKKIFPDLKIAMLHGKLKPKEKEKIMSEFKQKKTDILVSTSVVEVGIDIPNATVMMIEGAERFGLAQLYQFRGRVGRGKHQSYCFLFTESSSQTTNQRLKAVALAQSGFELAEKDLEIRGPGEFWGAQQWGLPDLTMASLSDAELIKSCCSEAKKLLDEDSELKNYPALKEKLSAFKSIVHLE